jgi:hypothetical protein
MRPNKIQILTAKKANPKEDPPEKHCRTGTSALEREIDMLVYELYGLTKEEIMIATQILQIRNQGSI